ncbi:alcohol dehydrogenase catalytic domain-containing protein [Candidatus Ichthyocystis sparus]|nr:zinc-binding dehydrogenase [Candidatus Ichthyocystis sparus]
MSLLRGEVTSPQKGQLRIRVAYAGVNRTDVYQLRGVYRPPHGANPIMGLEVSGIVDAIGEDVGEEWLGERVCALVNGGGYAEYVVCSCESCLIIPSDLPLSVAAGIPEAWFTAALFLHYIRPLSSNDRVLIHSVMSNVSRAAALLSQWVGANVWGTLGSERKCDISSIIDEKKVFFRNNDNWIQHLIDESSKVDVIFDVVGASCFTANSKLINLYGTWLIVGFLSGAHPSNISLAPILFKQVTLRGATMRSQPQNVVKILRDWLATQWKSGLLLPKTVCLNQIFELSQVEEAHRLLMDYQSVGKIVIHLSSD